MTGNTMSLIWKKCETFVYVKQPEQAKQKPVRLFKSEKCQLFLIHYKDNEHTREQ